MHELAIAHEIYRSCRAVVAEQGGGRLTEVRVAVGELTAIEPELLAFAWEAVVAEGPDRGTVLHVEWRPARQLCPRCQRDARAGRRAWLLVCPACQGPLTLEGGDDLDIVQVAFLAAREGAENHAER